MKRGLTCCFGGSLLTLITAALLLFVGLPALLQYLTNMDKQPIFDIQGIGQRHTVGVYDVLLTAITRSRCDVGDTCQQTDVSIEILMGGEAGSGTTYSISLLGQTVSDVIQLGDGTALRLISVPSDRASDEKDSVRFQAFLPPG